MQIAVGHNVTLTRSQVIAGTVALVLMVSVAGGMLVAGRDGLSDVLGVPGNSLPENTRPMILVPLPR
jgi:hypothetical protein